MAHAQDHRQASEPQLLDAIRAKQPLALAEAYHRTVPAAHAVARRLMPGAIEVETVLEAVMAQLWESPPVGVPLEGWVRRTTWAVCAEALRGSGLSPSSPSASGLLPDLPAPEVRFLDAAERAIKELPDDERRALLLAHDKGVATTAQDPGSGEALIRALLTLAGPETSSTDRAALDEDGADDVEALGDWCLGIADAQTQTSVEAEIAARPGCAAKSRAIRRGRRRIEGLPATPDMGQRVLVTVLTSMGATTGAPAVADAPDDVVEPAEPEAVAPMDDTADLPAAIAAEDPPETEAVDPFAPGPDDPFAPEAEPVPTAPEDWAPQPGDTSELRLSDILAGDDEDDDDPFASLEEPEPEPQPEPEPVAAAEPATDSSPYAALESLDGAADSLSAFGDMSAPVLTDPNAEVYVEGQEIPEAQPKGRGGSKIAALLSWLLPILGGAAVGVLLAVQVFGAPAN